MVGIKNKSGKYIRSKEHKRKLSEIRKGKYHSKETRDKISKSRLKRKEKLGYINSPETRKKIKEKLIGKRQSKKLIEKRRKGMIGHIVSLETKRKIGKANKGKVSHNKGKKMSDKQKRKIRISAFEYVKKIHNILWPCIGKNEKRILDKLEQELDVKIIRQYKCEGYFVDGYIEEINVVIEVDERPKIKDKDIERERIIKNKLNCKFVRINDFD